MCSVDQKVAPQDRAQSGNALSVELEAKAPDPPVAPLVLVGVPKLKRTWLELDLCHL